MAERLTKEVIVNILRMVCFALLIGALVGGTAYGGDKSRVGDTLPGFTLKSIDGKEVRLSQFQGKRPVLLVFGSST